MEDSYEIDISFFISFVYGIFNYCLQDVMVFYGDIDVILVIFIGEVLDDFVDLGLFFNRNNNVGFFDLEGVINRRVFLVLFQVEYSQFFGKVREEVFVLYFVFYDMGKGICVVLFNICKDGNLMEIVFRVIFFVLNFYIDNLNVKVKDKVYGCVDGERIQVIERVNF